MIGLIIDAGVTAVISSLITFVVFARYHAHITGRLIKQKFSMASESFTDGWNKAVVFMSEASEDVRKAVIKNLPKS